MLQTVPMNSIRIKYFTKELLDRYNMAAVSLNRRNKLSAATCNQMPNDNLYPVKDHEPNRYGGETVRIVINEQGDMAYLDLTRGEWESLPHRDIIKQ